MGKAHALLVPGDLKYLGAKFFPGLYAGRQAGEHVPEALHALKPECRAKPAGKELTLRHRLGKRCLRHRAGLQIFLQEGFAAQCQRFRVGLLQVHNAVAQHALELSQEFRPLRARKIHLIEEQEGGNIAASQELPQGSGVALHPGRGAHHQNGAVEHRERPLHLRGEVHVSRRIQERGLDVPRLQHGLLGEDGDSPLAFQGEGIEKGVAVIHPAEISDGARGIEQRLGEGRLARIHVRQDTNDHSFHVIHSFFTNQQMHYTRFLAKNPPPPWDAPVFFCNFCFFP